MLGALQGLCEDSLPNKPCGSTRINPSGPTSLAKDIYIVIKSKLWGLYFSERQIMFEFSWVWAHPGISGRWNEEHTFGLTDDDDWSQAGPPRQELSQCKLSPTLRKAAEGMSDSKSGVET